MRKTAELNTDLRHGACRHIFITGLCSILLISLVLLLLHSSGIAYAGGLTITRLTENSHVTDTQVNSNGHVVWSAHDGNDWEIFYYNGEIINQLTNDTVYYDTHPQINDSDQVVWQSDDIFLYSGGVTSKLTSNNRNDYAYYSPKINANGQIAWWSGNGNAADGYEIFLYSGGGISQITNYQGTVNPYDPEINDSGQLVWRGLDRSSYPYDWEIFLYSGGIIRQLTNNTSYESYPSINNSGQVVWSGHDGSDSEIFLYQGGITTKLTDNDFQDKDPKINNSGQVVWEAGPEDQDSEIFMWSGGITTQITDDAYYDDEDPAINDSGQIVWERFIPYDNEIFFYSNGVTKRLTENSSFDSYPQISDGGYVIWTAHTSTASGSYKDIYLASPCPAESGRPQLTLSLDERQAYWASYEDYLERRLNVDHILSNNGSAPAYKVQITGSMANNGVTSNTSMPISFGTIETGVEHFTLQYDIPAGVSRFVATMNASAEDGCGNGYPYPPQR